MQFKAKYKLLIAVALILVIVILYLLTNIFGDSEENADEQTGSQPPTADQLKKSIPQGIDTILFSFGIKKEWIDDINTSRDSVKIKKKKSRIEKDSAKYEKLWLMKEVTLPGDLPASGVILEISNYLEDREFDYRATEDPRTNDVNMEIFHSLDDSKKIQGVIYLTNLDSLRRNVPEVSLILANTERYKLKELNDILESTEEFTLELPDEYEYSDIQSAILQSGRDYILSYSIGGEDDFEADFRADMKEEQWKSKVKSISVAFPKASAVMLQTGEKLFKFEGNILAHFLKYRNNVYRDTLSVRISNETGNTVDELFAAIERNFKNGKKKQVYTVYFTPGDFKYYLQRLDRYKRKGYKFRELKRYIRNMEKQEKKREKKEQDKKDDKKESKGKQ